MKLFHGSNVEVKNPKINLNLRALDFGAGFYLTLNDAQAIKWAKIVTKRRRTGTPTLNIYDVDSVKFDTLHILQFKTANAAWLDFIVRNRSSQFVEIEYDIVIGPIANDATLPIIDDYMDGKYSKEEAIKRLLPQNLTDQHAFLTGKALSFLRFERSETL